MERELNKLTIEFNIRKCYYCNYFGWYTFVLGIYVLKTFPREGCMLSKENYKGFRIQFNFFLPIY